MHLVSAENEMNAFGAASKSNSHMDFLLHLKELGRRTAGKWLDNNWDMIGQDSSIDIKAAFL